jgi:hypothetical protein
MAEILGGLEMNYQEIPITKEYLQMRQTVENELSKRQEYWCVCGRLATGLHESNCRKFKDKVNKETQKRMEALK